MPDGCRWSRCCRRPPCTTSCSRSTRRWTARSTRCWTPSRKLLEDNAPELLRETRDGLRRRQGQAGPGAAGERAHVGVHVVSDRRGPGPRPGAGRPKVRTRRELALPDGAAGRARPARHRPAVDCGTVDAMNTVRYQALLETRNKSWASVQGAGSTWPRRPTGPRADPGSPAASRAALAGTRTSLVTRRWTLHAVGQPDHHRRRLRAAGEQEPAVTTAPSLARRTTTGQTSGSRRRSPRPGSPRAC